MKLFGIFLPNLQNLVNHGQVLLLNKKISHLPEVWIYFEEKIIIDEILNRILIVILLKHAVHKSKTKYFISEEIINSFLILANHSRWQID
jgi:hypothetical protein